MNWISAASETMKNRKNTRRIGVCAFLFLVTSASAAARVQDPIWSGADGVFDLALTPPAYVTDLGGGVFQFDLSHVDVAGPFQAGGNYDAARWAMIFDYQSVAIPQGATVVFVNHPSRAPVVWHAMADIDIAGVVNLDGESGGGWSDARRYAEPGPGGFRGGRGQYGFPTGRSSGLGPGGAFLSGCQGWGFGGAASFGTLGYDNEHTMEEGYSYGASTMLSLVGGSGGSGGCGSLTTGAGGAGGGALLLASENASVVVTGTVSVRGGNGGGSLGGMRVGGGGSGGAVRIVANEVWVVSSGNINFDARGGISHTNGIYVAGYGRIRIEANGASNLHTDDGLSIPEDVISDAIGSLFGTAPPGVSLLEYLDAQALPVAVAGDPLAQFYPPTLADLDIGDPRPVTFRFEVTNVPTDWLLYVRLTHGRGNDIVDPFSGNNVHGPYPIPVSNGIVEVTLDVTAGVSAIQARVAAP